MQTTTRLLPAQKSIALVAHDHCKSDLLNWVKQHANSLAHHKLYATGTTGHLIQQQTTLQITSMLSGPLGGDQQIGSLIAQGEIDLLIFFWDPLNAVPHDPDVKALLRLATLWNIPFATNVTTANLLLDSPHLNAPMKISIPDYQTYLKERIE